MRYIIGGALLVVVSFGAFAVADGAQTADDELAAVAATEPTPSPESTPTPLPTPTPPAAEPEASAVSQVANTEGRAAEPLVDEFFLPSFAATDDRTATATNVSVPDPTPTPAAAPAPPAAPQPTPVPPPPDPTPTPDPTPEPDAQSDGEGEPDDGDNGSGGGSGWPSPDQWEALRQCESGGNYSILSPGGLYRGAYQFSQSTWDWVASMRYPALVGVDPAQASPADQDAMAYALYEMNGWQPWPVCGRNLL